MAHGRWRGADAANDIGRLACVRETGNTAAGALPVTPVNETADELAASRSTHPVPFKIAAVSGQENRPASVLVRKFGSEFQGH